MVLSDHPLSKSQPPATISALVASEQNSAPNAIGSGSLSQTHSGAPPANITADYSGSNVKYYKAIKTFIGCATILTLPGSTNPGAPTVQAPQVCKLLFSGLNSKGAAISQTCSYSGTVNNPAMQECYFGPQFGEVVTLFVTVADSLTLPQTTVPLIDNFNHTNYY